jgi:peptidoglycan/xylan/chitin deacetylase (PgdA/CDA1 family)
MRGVPVLMYHRVFTDAAELDGWPKGTTRYWVGLEEFERQVRTLAAHGFRAVPLGRLLADAPPEATRPIVVTFDDGWASDHLYARPILDRLGWASEHFVTTDWIGTPAFMGWEALEDLAARGAGIHSHSATHRDFDRLAPGEVRDELERSKATLERRLGGAVEYLALPGGTGASREVKDTARELGYRAICTSKIGLNPPGADAFALRRIPVRRDTAAADLLNWVAGVDLERLILARETLRLTRALVPRALYGYVRERVLR